jgi:acyl-CoA synthetase (AMP-forming)/AMP-acid ligase II
MSLPALLALRSVNEPDAPAFVYLRNGEDAADGVTYAQLHRDVLARAAALADRRMTGHAAVLMYPTGLEFVRSWLGCAAAGVRGAPVQVPTRRQALRRVRAVADDAGTSVVLTTRAVLDRIAEDFPDAPELAGLDLVASDELPAGGSVPLPRLAPHDVALLQYTSGSTGDPKGVMVTHQNFWSTALATSTLCGCEPGDSVVSWLPLFHDMGLMFGVVLPLWRGMTSYLMEPAAFIRRPARWLEALSRFGAALTAAPNFAYDLCVREAPPASGTDLSALRCAVNGAEPVRPATVRDFTRTFAPYGLGARVLAPGYGLAEHTLTVSCSPSSQEPGSLRLSAPALSEGVVTPAAQADGEGAAEATEVMSCGTPGKEIEVRIVDPHTLRSAPPDRVGEIWVSGPCAALGYLGRPAETERTFQARISGEEELGERYLRTGDLGFLRDGQLYITGRLKDVLVVKGRNHYPQDLEFSVERSHPTLRPGCAAAFGVETGGRETLVLVAEADGRALRTAGAERLAAAMREAVRLDHRLEAEEVVLIRRGALPRTTSGKVRRRACRELYLADALPRVDGAARQAPVAMGSPA